MIKKEIQFSTKLDTAEFDRSVEMIQRKLKDIYAPSDMIKAQNTTSQRMQSVGMGGIMSGPGQQAYQQSTQQAKRELDALIRNEAQGQEKLAKMISSRVDKLKELTDQQKLLVKGSQEELDLKTKIARVEENNFRLKEGYKNRDAAMNQLLDTKSGGPQKNYLGMAASGLSSAGGAIVAGSELYRNMAATPIRTESSMGNAVQGTLGRDVSNIYGRRTGFEMMFSSERSKAAQLALDNMSANKLSDKFSLGGSMAMAVGGAATAATGVGVIPGIMSAGAGLYGMLGKERQRSLMLSPFSNTQSNRYNSILAEQASSDYQNSYDSLKKQNPFKTAAVGDYEQNYMRDLQSQRSMGLSNQGFRGDGGYMRQAIGAGFTPDMAMESSQGILGAGGSTRMARNSAFSLQAQRGLDLTNSNQVLGSLSSGLGSSEATKQATIKILAEGMKLGLDDSQFAEENRKFTQSAAEIVSRSGASTGGDFERVSSKFGSFVGENTNRGLDAAKSAYDEYQQISSSTTGPRGVMRAAGFLSDKNLSQLSTVEKQALMQVPEEQLNENNGLVKGAADKLGIDPGELVKSISGINRKSVNRFSDADKSIDTIKNSMKEAGIDKLDSTNVGSLSKEGQQAAYQLRSYQATDFGYKDQRTSDSRLFSAVNGGAGFSDIQKDREKVISGKMSGDSGRMEDDTIKAMAGDSSTILKNFNAMSGEMRAAAKSAAAFTDQIREMHAELIRALEDGRNGKGSKDGVLNALQRYSEYGKSQNQPQGGKPSK